MLHNIINQPSNNAFATPCVLVKKKDGMSRLCVDYRKLNEATIRNKFLIPMIEELVDELNGATVFSKLDLCSGYHQICMKEIDITKMVFRTHDNHFEFLVMSFGFTNTLTTLQQLMNFVFKPFHRPFVLIFFDDIPVYSSDQAVHVDHIHTVLQIFRDDSLFARRSKTL